MRFPTFLACLALATLAFAQSPTTRPSCLIGAYYFDGWTQGTDHLKPRLLKEFPEREPIWGWNDDSPEVMEKQIDLAADHGIDFFSFDWYWPEGEKKETPLNTGLSLFLKAPNRGRLQFCLMVANHGGFRIGPKDWHDVSGVWLELFQKATHITIDGKPLIIFFSPRELRAAFRSSAAVKEAFGQLREGAKKVGLPGVMIACCCTPGPGNKWDDLAELAADGYDVLTGYNYHGYPMKGQSRRQSYATMIDGHETIWNKFAERTTLPYIPCITAGWDKRPWEEKDLPEAKQSPYYPDRTPAQVAAFLRRAIRWNNANPDHTLKKRMVLIYAWNENGEGGYLTPTKSEGDKYLKAISGVLGERETP